MSSSNELYTFYDSPIDQYLCNHDVYGRLYNVACWADLFIRQSGTYMFSAFSSHSISINCLISYLLVFCFARFIYYRIFWVLWKRYYSFGRQRDCLLLSFYEDWNTKDNKERRSYRDELSKRIIITITIPTRITP